MFKGRKLLIVTKHQKQSVIAPILERELGVTCVVSETFDTDILGTFTGEIERKDNPVNTVRKKCELALESTNFDLVVASEGSFGPHPTLFFAHADEEIIIFIDKKNSLEIIAREISLDTNFDSEEISNLEDLLQFAKKAGFPEHALILKDKEKNFTEVYKGIDKLENLKELFNKLREKNATVWVETDMRAMYNPKRMVVIEKATKQLIDKINSLCPNCNTPGFSIQKALPGLPCENCNLPTRSTLSYVYHCQKCNFEAEKKFPKGKLFEEPMYCDNCNP